MKLVTFLPSAHPKTEPKIGVLLTKNQTIGDLQAANIVMSGAASPFFVDMFYPVV